MKIEKGMHVTGLPGETWEVVAVNPDLDAVILRRTVTTTVLAECRLHQIGERGSMRQYEVDDKIATG